MAVGSIETDFKRIASTQAQAAVLASKAQAPEHDGLVEQLHSGIAAQSARAAAGKFARCQCIEPQGDRNAGQQHQYQGYLHPGSLGAPGAPDKRKSAKRGRVGGVRATVRYNRCGTDGESWVTAIDIPGYVVRRELGAGGMASVHLAVQTSLEREVALKVMSPVLAADPTFSKRFLQEARMLASLAHPNIVQVYDVGVTPTQINYFSMQYLPGGDFGQRVRIGLPEKDLLRVLEGVANALGYAHQRGYVHRDVAPGNILFDLNDTPVLTDFGIARAVSPAARITSAGISIGTSHYMSPEQARGSDVDARSDLYGLGVLTWFGLTGKPPFEGADGFAVSYAHVFEPIPRLPAANAHWQGLIDKALAKDPAERFQTADEFIAALGRIEVRTASLLATAAEAEAPTRIMKRENLAAAAARAQQAEAPTRIGALPPIDDALRAQIPETAVDDTPVTRKWLPIALAIVGSVLVVAVGIALFLGREPASSPPAKSAQADPVKTPMPTRPPPVNEPTPATPAPVPVVTESADDGVSVPVSDEEIDFSEELDLGALPTVVDPVVELVRLARADLAAQRLTNPPRNNAFERFSLALRIDPKSRPATQGVIDTATAYVELAGKSLATGNLREFTDFLAKAEEVGGSIPDGAPAVASARAARKAEVDKLAASAEAAATNWDKATARADYEKILVLEPGNAKARDALRTVDRIGAPGYVFRDKAGSGSGPELVVVGARLAMARKETTRAEFARWWSAAGQRQFSGKDPVCRDRESVFRANRKRTWQSPGITQDDTHPVVCVSFAQAKAYAAWLSRETGKRYRLPTPAEWEQVARQSAAASCTTANLADASYRREFDARGGAECDDGHAATAPAGRFAAVAGVFDLDGNVREWVAACGKNAALTEGCRDHGVRGRGWVSAADRESVSESNSYADDIALNTLGLRVVREIEP